MTLSYRPITDPVLLNEYLERFETLVGVTSLPRGYFESNLATGAFDSSGKLIGGYTVANNTLARGLGVLPEPSRSIFLDRVPAGQITEVNGLWFEPPDKSMWARFVFWAHLWWDLHNTQRKYVLLWYNADIRYLVQMYSVGKTITLYRGPVRMQNGENRTFYFGYYRVSMLVIPFVKLMAFYALRLVWKSAPLRSAT